MFKPLAGVISITGIMVLFYIYISKLFLLLLRSQDWSKLPFSFLVQIWLVTRMVLWDCGSGDIIKLWPHSDHLDHSLKSPKFCSTHTETR